MSRYRINPGELRHIITFQRLDLDGPQNKYGEPIKWDDGITTRAGIYPISGKEFYAAETVNSEVTHKINIRYTEGLKPSMRIKFENRYFDIISIINFQEKNIMLQLLCKELI